MRLAVWLAPKGMLPYIRQHFLTLRFVFVSRLPRPQRFQNPDQHAQNAGISMCGFESGKNRVLILV